MRAALSSPLVLSLMMNRRTLILRGPGSKHVSVVNEPRNTGPVIARLACVCACVVWECGHSRGLNFGTRGTRLRPGTLGWPN